MRKDANAQMRAPTSSQQVSESQKLPQHHLKSSPNPRIAVNGEAALLVQSQTSVDGDLKLESSYLNEYNNTILLQNTTTMNQSINYFHPALTPNSPSNADSRASPPQFGIQLPTLQQSSISQNFLQAVAESQLPANILNQSSDLNLQQKRQSSQSSSQQQQLSHAQIEGSRRLSPTIQRNGTRKQTTDKSKTLLKPKTIIVNSINNKVTPYTQYNSSFQDKSVESNLTMLVKFVKLKKQVSEIKRFMLKQTMSRMLFASSGKFSDIIGDSAHLHISTIRSSSQPLSVSEKGEKHCGNLLKRIINSKTTKVLAYLCNRIPTIEPSSTLKLVWDLLLGLVLSVYFFFIPVHIALNRPMDELITPQVEYALHCCIVADILMQMNTAYFEKGVNTFDKEKIFAYYLKQYGLIDVISQIPLLYSELDTQDSQIKRIFLLSFFVKIRNFMKIFRKLEESFHLSRRASNLISLFKLILTILFFSHIFACVWIFTGSMQQDSSDITWLTKVNIDMTTAQENWTQMYIAAYYFSTVTMITVGYGDITPMNNLERVVSVGTMLISCVIFAYTINQIGTIFADLFSQDRQLKEYFSIINDYMDSRNIAFSLQYEIREYLDYYWREQDQDKSEREKKIIESLSDRLREKLMIEANRIVLKDAALFSGNFTANVILKMIPIIQTIHTTPNQVIFTEGSIDDDMFVYFIEKGKVEVCREAVIQLATQPTPPPVRIVKAVTQLGPGSCFGAYSFITNLERKEMVRTVEFSKLLMVRRSDFLNLLSEHPMDLEKFNHIRDSVLFENNHEYYDVKCAACSSYNHDIQHCHFFHFQPDRYAVIQRQNFQSKEQQRDQQFRRNSQFGQSISHSSIVDACIRWKAEQEENLDQYVLTYLSRIDEFAYGQESSEEGTDEDNGTSDDDSDDDDEEEEEQDEVLQNSRRSSSISKSSSVNQHRESLQNDKPNKVTDALAIEEEITESVDDNSPCLIELRETTSVVEIRSQHPLDVMQHDFHDILKESQILAASAKAVVASQKQQQLTNMGIDEQGQKHRSIVKEMFDEQEEMLLTSPQLINQIEASERTILNPLFKLDGFGDDAVAVVTFDDFNLDGEQSGDENTKKNEQQAHHSAAAADQYGKKSNKSKKKKSRETLRLDTKSSSITSNLYSPSPLKLEQPTPPKQQFGNKKQRKAVFDLRSASKICSLESIQSINSSPTSSPGSRRLAISMKLQNAQQGEVPAQTPLQRYRKEKTKVGFVTPEFDERAANKKRGVTGVDDVSHSAKLHHSQQQSQQFPASHNSPQVLTHNSLKLKPSSVEFTNAAAAVAADQQQSFLHFSGIRPQKDRSLSNNGVQRRESIAFPSIESHSMLTQLMQFLQQNQQLLHSFQQANSNGNNIYPKSQQSQHYQQQQQDIPEHTIINITGTAFQSNEENIFCIMDFDELKDFKHYFPKSNYMRVVSKVSAHINVSMLSFLTKLKKARLLSNRQFRKQDEFIHSSNSRSSTDQPRKTLQRKNQLAQIDDESSSEKPSRLSELLRNKVKGISNENKQLLKQQQQMQAQSNTDIGDQVTDNK